jgi:GWxTD domain-containing protein
LKSLLVVLFAALLLGTLAGGTSRPALAGEPPLQLSDLRGLVNAHPDSALLHARLASAYFGEGTVEGRSLATKHLKWALRLDPGNNGFRLMLSEVYFAATFWGRGVEQLERILDTEPANAEARLRLGRAYLDRATEEWQKAMFQCARHELLLVDETSPAFARAQRKLALCRYDMGSPDSAAALLSRLPPDSLDAEALLVLGMAFNDTGDLAAADSTFTQALSKMGPEERDRYLAVDLIAVPEEIREPGGKPPEGWNPQTSPFWKRRDPNPATPYNERFIEHMARVAFADFHFSVPRLGKHGSQTTRGEVYIRYGRPLVWLFDPFGDDTFTSETVAPLPGRSDLGAPSSGEEELEDYRSYTSRPRHLDRPRWVWRYRDFMLDFEDTFLNGDFSFPYERDWSAYTYAYLERQVPEIYETQIKKRMHVVLDAVNRMDEEGRPHLTLFYACDTRGVDCQPDYEWPEGDFEVQIALLDTAYTDIARSQFKVKLSADSKAMFITPYPMISKSDFTIRPGEALASVSIRSESNGAVGYSTRRIKVRPFDTELEVSDVELRFADEGPANPSHIFLWRGRAYLAFDIYNLAADEVGTGRAEVVYSITRRQEAVGTVKRLMDYLGFGPSPATSDGIASIASRYELRSPGPNISQRIGLDLKPLSKGFYDIELSVRDLLTGRVATVSTSFRIASELRP